MHPQSAAFTFAENHSNIFFFGKPINTNELNVETTGQTGDNGRQREATLGRKKSATNGTKGQEDNGRQRETTP